MHPLLSSCYMYQEAWGTGHGTHDAFLFSATFQLFACNCWPTKNKKQKWFTPAVITRQWWLLSLGHDT
jgi:hypothetical protein